MSLPTAPFLINPHPLYYTAVVMLMADKMKHVLYRTRGLCGCVLRDCVCWAVLFGYDSRGGQTVGNDLDRATCGHVEKNSRDLLAVTEEYRENSVAGILVEV